MAVERLRPPRPTVGPTPGGGPDPFDAPQPADPGLCTITVGHYGELLPVAGLRVRDIRTRFRDRFDIDPQSRAILDDGTEVDDDYVIRAGQSLMFSRKAGEKGSWR